MALQSRCCFMHINTTDYQHQQDKFVSLVFLMEDLHWNNNKWPLGIFILPFPILLRNLMPPFNLFMFYRLTCNFWLLTGRDELHCRSNKSCFQSVWFRFATAGSIRNKRRAGGVAFSQPCSTYLSQSIQLSIKFRWHVPPTEWKQPDVHRWPRQSILEITYVYLNTLSIIQNLL